MVSCQIWNNFILLQDSEEIAFVGLADVWARERIYDTLKPNMSVCLSETSADLRIVSQFVIKLCGNS